MPRVIQLSSQMMILLITTLLLCSCGNTLNQTVPSQPKHSASEVKTSPLPIKQSQPLTIKKNKSTPKCFTCYRVGHGRFSRWDDASGRWSNYNQIPPIGTIIKQHSNHKQASATTVTIAAIAEFKYLPINNHKRVFHREYPILSLKICENDDKQYQNCANRGKYSSDSISETTERLFAEELINHPTYTITKAD